MDASPSGHGEFTNLVGSTALSVRMGPEDLREVISVYQKCVAETVGRYGGFVANNCSTRRRILQHWSRVHAKQEQSAGLAPIFMSGPRARTRPEVDCTYGARMPSMITVRLALVHVEAKRMSWT